MILCALVEYYSAIALVHWYGAIRLTHYIPLSSQQGRLWRCFYRRVCCTHHTTTNITDPMHDQEQPTDSDHFKYRDSQDGLDIVTPSESQSGRQLGVDYTGSGGSGLPFVDLEGQQGGEGEGQEQDARRHAISNTTSDGGHEGQ